jgi:hypothetical protein
MIQPDLHVAMKIIDVHIKTRLPKNNYFNAELAYFSETVFFI